MKICPNCKTKYDDDSARFCRNDGSALETDLEAFIGLTLDGHYKIEAMLGQGGMGAVYRARHTLLGDNVAIKIILPEISEKETFGKRFLREGQAARHLRHP